MSSSCCPKGPRFSSIGKKSIMAITGLLLCGFLLTHLAANLLIIFSPEAYNRYAHALMTNPLIVPMEIALGLLFLSHIVMGIRLTIENFRARPTPYAMRVNSGRGSTFASRTMPYTGAIILIFLILHVIQFRFGPHYPIIYTDGVNDIEMRDLHTLVMQLFAQLPYVIWYVFAQIALGVHLSHGFQSAFGSLGFYHERYNCWIRSAGNIFAILIAAGFSAIPIWAYYVQTFMSTSQLGGLQ
jgi:succinate dehydrogenase / fumarate reductase cytochrome b subunit